MGEKGPGEGQLQFNPDDTSQDDNVINSSKERKPEVEPPSDKRPGVEETVWHRFNEKEFRSTGIDGGFIDHIQQLEKLVELQGESGISVKIEREKLAAIFEENFPRKEERDILLKKLNEVLEELNVQLKEAEKKYDKEDRAGQVFDQTYSKIRAQVERTEAAIRYVEHAEKMIAERHEALTQKKSEVLSRFETETVIADFGSGGWERTLKQIAEYVSGMDPRRNQQATEAEFSRLRDEFEIRLRKNFPPLEIKLLVMGLMDQATEAQFAYAEIEQRKDRGLEFSEKELTDAHLRYDKATIIFELVSSLINGVEFSA